jgi:hypothetical protein
VTGRVGDLKWALKHVVTDPRFVELSNWPAMEEPWAIGLRLGGDHRITWLHGTSKTRVLERALRAIELLGVEDA